jgi:hypothetical protein
MSLYVGYLSLLRKVFGITCLFVVQTFAANLSTNVGFPSAPQSQRGCTKNRTDNLTTVCSAALNDTEGTALASTYQSGAHSYVVFGTIHVTRPQHSATTTRASLSATLTEFSEQTSGGVRLTSSCAQDCEPIAVTVNGLQVGVLSDNQSLDIPYAQQPLLIVLSAQETAFTSGIDYVGLFNITATSY